MKRDLPLGLNNFAPIPPMLLDPSTNTAVDDIEVDLTELFHIWYLDTYGPVPKPNPVYNLYAPMLTTDKQLRLSGDGLGTHKEPKVGLYNQLGKAFCRWFLYNFCGITYYVHVDKVVDKQIKLPYYTLKRKPVPRKKKNQKKEDLSGPDFVCAKDNRSRKFYLAEAKGTSYAISFTNTKFGEWRKQFTRVGIYNSLNTEISVKGYIVATRAVSEESYNVNSILLAEDPNTEGINPGENELANLVQVWRMVIAGHYEVIMDKLRLPLLAALLRSDLTVPHDFEIRVPLWECLVPPAQGLKFIGGFFPSSTDYCPDFDINFYSDYYLNYRRGFFYNTSLNLMIKGATFFGLEAGIFKSVFRMLLEGRDAADAVEELTLTPTLDHTNTIGLSLLRDGTVLAPLEYFRLVDFITFNAKDESI